VIFGRVARQTINQASQYRTRSESLSTSQRAKKLKGIGGSWIKEDKKCEYILEQLQSQNACI